LKRVVISKPRIAAFGLAGALFMGAAAQPIVSWDDLTEVDWLFSLATRFSLLDGHKIHYKTPTAELASLLEARPEADALRHLAQAQMDLGQREKALATIEKWATSATDSKGAAWDEAAQWAWSYGAQEAAFRFADRGVDALKGEPQRTLANLRVQWAEEQPALLDRRAMQRAALELNATDWATAYSWVDGDIAADQLAAAEQGLASLPKSTPEEPALVLKARLRAAQLRGAEILPSLDSALDKSPHRGRLFAAAYVSVVDQASKNRPEEWRQTLNARFDAAVLSRLFTYFKGQERGDACLGLLQQIDRRYQKTLDRAGWALVSSLYSEIDAVPEAFRARLAAASFTEAKADEADLADLIRLALRAGGRPLAWGNYADADYRWVARMDPTPGFWTGGLTLLLTGQDWSEALSRLEAESIPERTFGAARALLAELTRRNPNNAALPGLKVEVMRRHVDRGEGRPALDLLREIEANGSPDERLRARTLGLLALRQTKAPLADEVRLYKAQLRHLSPDGSSPEIAADESEPTRRFQVGDFTDVDPASIDGATGRKYKSLLDEAISRLEERDKTHRTSVTLILGELDRLPNAEPLWLDLAARLSAWNLDDELGPRYEAALQRFDDASWWNRMARFLTRQKRSAEIRALAEKLAATFRGAAIFERASDTSIRIEIPEQPKVGVRTRLVPWGDWVILKALERFPHSPAVLHAAEGRLISASRWQRIAARTTDARQPAVVEDSLLAERRWAIFAADPAVREVYFAGLMRTDGLEAKLRALDRATARTPVDELILAEGYARLSLFEKAADAASRLSASYPGDPGLAHQALQIHRSLAGLDLAHEAPAKAVVERSTLGLVDPNPLVTELGELYEETGRPAIALSVWKKLLERDPRQEERIKETATLLWDYGHMREALDTIEAGRTRVGRPRMLAFEAGVLREEVKDVDGAIREYLDAVLPGGDADSCYCSGFENDQRSLRRLSQWMGRERVLKRVLASIDSLKPGNAADEKTLLAFWPLGSIETPTAGLDWDADDWIDGMDQPNDPVGRAEREAKRLAARGTEHAGIARVGQALVSRATALLPAATSGRFLNALESAATAYPAAAWPKAEARDRFFTGIVARQAELAPTIEERLRLEIDLAQRLASGGRLGEADALWQSLATRIETLPESAAKIKALVARVQFVERNSGFDKARVAWDGLNAKYPWSLGVIEDRVAFLTRHGKTQEALQALEDATVRAASGHLVPMLNRLVSESLVAKDLGRASRTLDRFLKTPTLTDEERLGATSLLARLRIQQDAAFDATAFATAEASKVKSELRAQVFAEVARAAFTEKAYATSVSVWIEALNRDTQRDWLKEASRASRKTGKPEVLVSFFEKQQQRSPRDVRWAVAARELRVATDNLPGGIEMARIAANIRPERGELWNEAVELMERDMRFVEAADFLEGWNVQRPDDSGVAAQRSALYLRGGDLKKAVAVERAALDAFEKREIPADAENSEDTIETRTAAAARRLWQAGQPQLAWRFLSEDGTPDAIEASMLTTEEGFQLALLNNAFMPLLNLDVDDADRLAAAGSVLGQYGRIENREQVLSFIVEKLFPSARVDDAFLNKWWPFIRAARLEAPLQFRLSQRFARQITGPWSQDTPIDVLDDASFLVITQVMRADQTGRDYVIKAPDFDALWAAHLVRFARADDLARFLAPRFTTLIETVRGPSRLTAESKRLPWTAWLDSTAAMDVFSRGLKTHPELVASLSSVFEDRRLWDRLWAIGARGWETSPLLAAIRPQARVAWLSFWERPVVLAAAPGSAAPVEDSVLTARRNIVTQTSLSLSEYLSEPAATSTTAAPMSPFAQRLLGPSILSDTLGGDAKFTWAFFRPRTNAAGDVLETGDDRVAGRGIDTARFPGALWGERPGAAWFALQTYARYRANDPSAIDVPDEWPGSGGETERALLTARLALALQGPSAALAQIERLGLRTNDTDLLRFRLRLLVEAGRRTDAAAVLNQRVTANQKRLTEAELRTLTSLAEDFELPAPLSVFDPAVPLQPALLASLYDSQGSEVGRRFKTDDPIGFRAALAARWSERSATLKAPELRFWLTELWAAESAPFPRGGVSRLGPFWPSAATWAESVARGDRSRVIAAVDALPTSALLEALPASTGDPGARLVLTLRARLARGEDQLAVGLFRNALRASTAPDALSLRPIALESEESVEGQLEGGESTYDAGEAEDAPEEQPAALATLTGLRAPFLDAKKAALIQADVEAWLDQQIENEPAMLAYWKVRLEVANTNDRDAIVEKLSRAYRRGDIATYRHGEIAGMLVGAAKEHAAPWVKSTASSWSSFATVREHAVWLQTVGLGREAALYLAEARSKALFERAEEITAFDLWRKSVDTSGNGPEAWKLALRFWRDNADTIAEPLQARLKDHSFDVLSARAALRRPTALPLPTALLAIRALRDIQDLGLIDIGADESLLRFRAARSLVGAGRAVGAVGGAFNATAVEQDLKRRRFRAADIDTALADVARIASARGDRSGLLGALNLLADRKWAGARALRAEFASALIEPPIVTHRVVGGHPLLYRPRDLTFALVSQIVQSDLSRRTPSPSSNPTPVVR
jgi:hypothetical protein